MKNILFKRLTVMAITITMSVAASAQAFGGYYGIGKLSPNIISILFFVLILSWIFNSIKNRGIVHLSLSKFTIDPENEDMIIIEGRKTGLMQWLLVKLKLGNIYKIQVKKDFITYSEDSAFGKILSLVPMHKVSSTTCGYKKPIIFLILAALSVIMSIVSLLSNAPAMTFLLCLIFAAGFVAAYIYLKSFFIKIEAMGSSRFGFTFRKALIENISIDIEKIEEAIKLINNVVIANK